MRRRRTNRWTGATGSEFRIIFGPAQLLGNAVARSTQTLGGCVAPAGTPECKSIATLHLICGLPCSGKTTLAKVLERELPALRLAPDEWIVRLFGPDIADEALDAVRDPVEAALWDLTAHVLVLGLDVILEYGFWTRAEREEFRRRAAVLGARSKLYFTDASEEELLRRLAQRNTDRPAGTFRIGEAQLRWWMRTFEPPEADELAAREVPGSAEEQ